MQQLILGSSSPARKQLLDRLGVPYEVAHPNIDESSLSNEQPIDLVARLAKQKAIKVSEQFPEALIIACDQMIVLDEQVFGKPHTHEDAVAQLRLASGRELLSLTAVALLNAKTNSLQLQTIPYQVTFRQLTDEMIENYLRIDQPYQCAGSIKAEQLGISLFSSMQGDDYTALIGLPLIALVDMLNRQGVDVLSVAAQQPSQV